MATAAAPAPALSAMELLSSHSPAQLADAATYSLATASSVWETTKSTLLSSELAATYVDAESLGALEARAGALFSDADAKAGAGMASSLVGAANALAKLEAMKKSAEGVVATRVQETTAAVSEQSAYVQETTMAYVQGATAAVSEKTAYVQETTTAYVAEKTAYVNDTLVGVVEAILPEDEEEEEAAVAATPTEDATEGAFEAAPKKNFLHVAGAAPRKLKKAAMSNLSNLTLRTAEEIKTITTVDLLAYGEWLKSEGMASGGQNIAEDLTRATALGVASLSQGVTARVADLDELKTQVTEQTGAGIAYLTESEVVVKVSQIVSESKELVSNTWAAVPSASACKEQLSAAVQARVAAISEMLVSANAQFEEDGDYQAWATEVTSLVSTAVYVGVSEAYSKLPAASSLLPTRQPPPTKTDSSSQMMSVAEISLLNSELQGVASPRKMSNASSNASSSDGATFYDASPPPASAGDEDEEEDQEDEEEQEI